MDANDRARQNRLRWHCRRALLELDLVFQRFWSRVEGGMGLDAQSEATLTRLLAMEDHDLWALVSGKESSEDSEVQAFVERLRQV